VTKRQITGCLTYLNHYPVECQFNFSPLTRNQASKSDAGRIAVNAGDSSTFRETNRRPGHGLEIEPPVIERMATRNLPAATSLIPTSLQNCHLGFNKIVVKYDRRR
jgi:hypothetical protein